MGMKGRISVYLLCPYPSRMCVSSIHPRMDLRWAASPRLELDCRPHPTRWLPRPAEGDQSVEDIDNQSETSELKPEIF